MGKWRPGAAVTSAHLSIADSMESGREVAALLHDLGVVGPEMTTLQVGSGLGRVEYHLHTQVRRCCGADISASMVRRARRLVPFPNVEFVVSDGVSLAPWADGTFDLVYSFFVFQHLPRAQFDRYLAEAAAKLAPGGHLVFQLIVDDEASHPDPPPSHPYGIRYYRRREVEDKLRHAGYRVGARCDLQGRPDDTSVVSTDVVFCATRP